MLLVFGIAASSAIMAAAQESDAKRIGVEVVDALMGDADDEREQDAADIIYCGGKTTRGEVSRFFEELSQGIESDRSAVFFNQFVAEQFNALRNERRLTFDREDFKSVTPRFFSWEDWLRIDERGASSLEDMGWRGCMMDRGKVWFQADEKGLRISSINHDMPWLASD